jgi:hypothetical protein
VRLWTLHPRYLDTRGLVALWREALLARAVLRGRTRGYRHHPQLTRFRRQADPVACVNAYLRYERGHLMRKLKVRDGERYRTLARTRRPLAHPLFRIGPGGVRWG